MLHSNIEEAYIHAHKDVDKEPYLNSYSGQAGKVYLLLEVRGALMEVTSICGLFLIIIDDSFSFLLGIFLELMYLIFILF